MKRIITLIGLYLSVALCYGVTAAISYFFFNYNILICSIWPASGVALGALLLFGKRLWPSIFVSSMVINIFAGMPLWMVIVSSLLATLEPLICHLLIERLIGFDKILINIKNFAKFCLAAGITSLVSTMIIFFIFILTELFTPTYITEQYLVYWLSHFFPMLIAPLLVFTWHEKKGIFKSVKKTEYLFFFIILLSITHANFGGLFSKYNTSFSSYRYLLTVIFTWAAYRYDLFEIAISLLLVGYLATFEVMYMPYSFKDRSVLTITLWIGLFITINYLLTLIINLTVRSNRQMTKKLIRFERLNLVGETAAGLAHEIRNPITSVRGFLQILCSKNPNDSNYYELMISELDSANAIITEYLLLAKDKYTVLKPYDLNQIIETLYPLINSIAIKNDQQVILNLHQIPSLNLDENEIKRLIINICKNGLESMDSYGILQIETFIGDGNVVLRISDHGKGIPPNILDKIGTPFFTTKESGMGLGMAICYSIAERHNAIININSSSSGTTIDLIFKDS